MRIELNSASIKEMTYRLKGIGVTERLQLWRRGRLAPPPNL
jgi:hypothetical protein